VKAVRDAQGGRRLVAPSPRLCAITDIGTRRSNNEDRFFLSDDGRLWIVADGMGGQAAGEIASTLAVDAIVESMNGPSPPDDPVGPRLLRALARAQDSVLEYSAGHEDCGGMGSAVLAACLEGDRLHLCYAGDVRCYVLSRGVLEQVTRDHSLAALLVRAGLLPAEQARFHSGKGLLEQAVGLRHGFNPALTCHSLLADDRVLVCSDGLWETLGDDEIAAFLSCDAPVRQTATDLTDRANACGGQDNITVVVYRHT
jgi:serine/threonine protein phosphatase PrpC